MNVVCTKLEYLKEHKVIILINKYKGTYRILFITSNKDKVNIKYN